MSQRNPNLSLIDPVQRIQWRRSHRGQQHLHQMFSNLSGRQAVLHPRFASKCDERGMFPCRECNHAALIDIDFARVYQYVKHVRQPCLESRLLLADN